MYSLYKEWQFFQMQSLSKDKWYDILNNNFESVDLELQKCEQTLVLTSNPGTGGA